MTDQLDDSLSKQLAALTAWPGEAPGLWRRAWKSAAASAPARPSFWTRVFSLSRPLRIAACVIPLVPIAIAALLLPGLHRARDLQGSLPVASPAGGESYAVGAPAGTLRRTERMRQDFAPARSSPADESEAVGPPSWGAVTLYSYAAGSAPDQVVAGVPYLKDAVPAALPPPAGDAAKAGADTLPRQVIRKATIELATTDVRAVFLKAGLIISQARGEYVEDSALTGSGKEAQANLTLRVEASRLDQVLNALRDLGEIRAERVEGQDVTAQVVDIQARLRNEQRVEGELLELLEKRQDAPLKEVLELREKIGQIRQEIERLTAQRDQLSRLVSLATVLVIIRPGDAPAQASGLFTYFAEACRTAWTASIRFLADTVAVLLALLVGGFIWWVLLLAAILLIRRHLRRKAT